MAEQSTETEQPTDPWGSTMAEPEQQSWLAGDESVTETGTFDWTDPFEQARIPLDVWVEQGLDWLVTNFRPVFQSIRLPIDATLQAVESSLQAMPALLLIALFTLIAWQFAGRRLAIGTLISLVSIGLIGAWTEAMITLSLVLTSVFFCLIIGLPAGIWLARSDRAAQSMRPVLDAMQTTPAFVYLVPIVMLFGIGNVPGVVVTIIFALPPLIRLTNLGIRQVPADLVEAARAFGASPRQLLFKVQLPLALPTIMAGVNQTLMLALSMVVIASMIAVGGLGQMVLRGIGRLDMGLATVGGVGIVLLAIILDRITQSMGQESRVRGARHWYETGPAGVVRKLFIRNGNRSHQGSN
ncbi:MAG: glycine betaine/L-proline ABC transporter permease ProW [Gammaproteobacteria bacterium]